MTVPAAPPLDEVWTTPAMVVAGMVRLASQGRGRLLSQLLTEDEALLVLRDVAGPFRADLCGTRVEVAAHELCALTYHFRVGVTVGRLAE